ncbi:MAG: signal peptidase I [Thiothrix sp.]|nr:signal peptidase I [Thiothrix sp.]HPQ96528.1 signal peptidase I [Thiolinea sp.]
MDFDLELWLVIVTALCGIIWFFYWLLTRNRSEKGVEPWYVEYARSFFPVLLIVLLLRSFVAEPFRIPSGSMLPTLEIGDFILVSKFAYGVRLPVTHTKLVDVGEPKTGDVVVFRFPNDPSVDYIKRLVGMPGDLVEWNNKELLINGEVVGREPLGGYEARDQRNIIHKTERLRETLGGVGHDILILPGTGGRTGRMVVPEGHYFVMGDNRDMSNDSRMWGLVPEENLVGKAILVWLHFNWGGDGLSFSRIGLID